MNANYFEYNGVISAQYGLKMASFEAKDGVEEISAYSPTISTSKPKKHKRFYTLGVSYSDPPEQQISLVCEGIITPEAKREILAWLSDNQDFKKLVIHSPELEMYYYRCIFKDIQTVNVNGVCVGFTMTAVFDSYYQYGTDSVRALKDGNYNNYELKIPNLSDIQEYVYPIVELTVTDLTDNTVSIINKTDDETREFKLVNIPVNTKIIIDNELKIIDGSGISLSDFNKNWLRLRKGVNKLTITMKGSLKITCPQYACLGF